MWNKTILGLIFLFLFCGCITDKDEPAWSLQPGDHIPEFRIVMNDGGIVTSRSLEGRRSIIIFFSTTCQDCRNALPKIQTAYEQSLSQEDAPRYICISREENDESISSYWVEHNLSLPYSAQDTRKVYNLFASSGIPRVYEVSSDLIIEKCWE